MCHRRLPFNIISLSSRSLFCCHISSQHCLYLNNLIVQFASACYLIRSHINYPTIATNMCIRVVERYAVCRCVYYSHAIDACPAYGRRDHAVRTKEVLVGYTCSRHSTTSSQPSTSQPRFPDSGYSSGSYSRNYTSSSRR